MTDQVMVTGRARDYVVKYMAARFTPGELEARRKATADWLDDQPCGDGLCECDAP